MKIVLFYHSLASDWNHGNAHFLRGVCSELLARGHVLRVLEPRDGWSARNLVRSHGAAALGGYRGAYPQLQSHRYGRELELDAELEGADVAIVHEWNPPELVARVGAWFAKRKRGVLLFHDTHHRAVSAPHELARYDLRHYDGVLAFGDVLRERYAKNGWARRVFVWHEAADVEVFRPRVSDPTEPLLDLLWVGNWGDDERSEELRRYLVRPAADLGLRARIHGVRYPAAARSELRRAGIDYAGFLPNYRVPDAFAQARLTVHVPRRPYVRKLPGIPTIRVFEALACGIPLICSPWHDVEGLFTPGDDYLVARSGREMKRHMQALLADEALAARLAAHGRKTILARHTCAHRVDELLSICATLGAPVDAQRAREPARASARKRSRAHVRRSTPSSRAVLEGGVDS